MGRTKKMITNIKIGCYEDLTIKANKRFVSCNA
jgi:hypothetical protein